MPSMSEDSYSSNFAINKLKEIMSYVNKYKIKTAIKPKPKEKYDYFEPGSSYMIKYNESEYIVIVYYIKNPVKLHSDSCFAILNTTDIKKGGYTKQKTKRAASKPKIKRAASNPKTKRKKSMKRKKSTTRKSTNK